MSSLNHLQDAIDYIESHLTSELSIEDIAEVSGYSMYHFCHVFSNLVGCSVKAFVTKRRLLHAMVEISVGNKAIDVALAYGFDTYAGFYKAFKHEFGCSISTYCRLNHVKKPKQFNLAMEVKMSLTHQELRKLLQQWPIDVDHQRIERIQSSKMNAVWSVGEDYILKSGKNIQGLNAHIAISNHLTQFDFQMALPVVTNDFQEYLTRDDRYFVLTHKVKGQTVQSSDWFGLSGVDHAKNFGMAIGKLHHIFEQNDAYFEVNESNLLYNVTSWALPKTKLLMEQWGSPLPDGLFEDYLRFNELHPLLKKHVIHRDMHPGNIVTQHNQVTGFIDFDITERNVRLFDLCYCATAILSGAKSDEEKDQWIAIFEALVVGYDSINPLSEVEKQSIVYVIDSIQMIFIAWLDGKDEYKELSMINRNMLVWLYEHRQALLDLDGFMKS